MVINPFVIPGANLAAKLSWLQAEAVSGVEYIIEVNTTESIGPTTLSYSGKNNITIRLKGLTTERIINLSSNGSMFGVWDGVTLILENNITLQGRNNNNNELVYVTGSGTLIMNTGSKITGNTNVSTSILSGGGGVSVGSGGTFSMSGGIINNNISDSAGGGVYVVNSTSTFTMTGGEISGNICTSTSTSSWYGGGGVHIQGGGTFNMSGGSINNNTANGLGGGVMIGSSITGNFTMSGTAIIDNNKANSGGGVMILGDNIFTLLGGTISNNKAENGSGGGVNVNTNGTFIMSGGNIHNNTAPSNLIGGGVWVSNNGTYNMSGGTIRGNTSGGGAGVGIGANGTFSKQGGGIIYGYNEGTNSNIANAGYSYAIYWGSSPMRYRDTTVGTNDNISTAVTTSPPWG